MLNSPKNQHGFTLVELLIAVAIMAILLAAAAPSFRGWIQNAQVRTAAESISAGLQMARVEAVRRNTSVQFSLPGADSSWTLGCVNVVADLDGDGVADCPAVIQSHSGAEGTSHAVVAVVNPIIIFNGLGRANLAMTVNVTNPTGGACQPGGPTRCLNILVTTGGQAHMCDPALPITDPQAC